MGVAMSGFCNCCRCPINTRQACWCKDCHARVVARFRQRCSQPIGGSVHDGDGYTVSLHVGFVFVAETDEMLSRLMDEPVAKAKPAKGSKISDPAGRVPTPIDRVASRVTGLHEVV